MTLTLTLGGTSLALPAAEGGIAVDRVPIGASRRMLGGAMRVDYRTIKASIRLSWEGLTAAERATLWLAYAARLAAAGNVVLPDAQTFSVMAAANTWTETVWYNWAGTPYYNVTFQLEEA